MKSASASTRNEPHRKYVVFWCGAAWPPGESHGIFLIWVHATLQIRTLRNLLCSCQLTGSEAAAASAVLMQGMTRLRRTVLVFH